jgi:Bacterial antitoxin of type II TA system, VapB
MVSNMKTTIDIADDLLARAKRQAEREKRTLKEIVEEALRRQLASTGGPRGFKYRPHIVKGKGLQPGIAEGNWDQVRDLIHKVG